MHNTTYIGPFRPSPPDSYWADYEPDDPDKEEKDAADAREEYADWFGDGTRETYEKLIQYAEQN